ncbi:hypothetical protein FisN_4Hh349 [Fistulifera solaris]|uniref:NAD-dependent epimerase/dehydratase domain-containing protein n=1 Tax=Fistulifera solaris TaxID=1519565 RepID=A0A1Z5KQ72_FISSO|nr:hypothetical protein FisN_4Hh349 [Fistulifera solaris]|eukprot:GAX28460.1 hypothetical protein FisN_4Hh349 [Fistulifera solaris]
MITSTNNSLVKVLTLLGWSAVATAFVVPQTRTFPTELYSSALIVQNKGGGHGEIGYHLAQLLQDHPKITSVTILQDDACDDEAEPFCSYFPDLRGVTIMKAPLSAECDRFQMQGMLGGRDARFDYVWDNNSKKPTGGALALLECAAAWNVTLYTYVSSAGMYKPQGVFPMPEDTPVKETADQNLFDQKAIELNLPYVSFRPQYIYGPKANKNDYLDYFLDRLVRELPVPIPGDGSQLVSLTHARDVASLLASVLNNEDAAKQQRFFNCGTDQLVSYKDVADICAKAAAIEKYETEFYDAELFDKTKFPFRDTDFYVAPDKAKELLGWSGPTHNLKDDMTEWYFEQYKARGGPEKKMSFLKDWEIVVGSKTPPPGYVESIYDKYDPLVIEMEK